jgi:hypothetical protein
MFPLICLHSVVLVSVHYCVEWGDLSVTRRIYEKSVTLLRVLRATVFKVMSARESWEGSISEEEQ